MPDEEKKSPDPKESEKDEKQEEQEAPDEGQSGKAEEEAQAPLKDLPEKLQGKTAKEIADMYSNLEKKIGEQSTEVGEAKKYLAEREMLAKAVTQNPELYKMLDNELRKVQGVPEESQKESGEAKKEDPKLADLRRVEENRIIGEFQRNFGLDKLSKEDRQELMKKVSGELAEIADPGGTKQVQQILSEMQLEKLPILLEKSYWLANKERLMDRGRLSDQDTASIGSISASSSGKSDETSLTDRERTIAERLGIKSDQYLKQKQLLQKEE